MALLVSVLEKLFIIFLYWTFVAGMETELSFIRLMFFKIPNPNDCTFIIWTSKNSNSITSSYKLFLPITLLTTSIIFVNESLSSTKNISTHPSRFHKPCSLVAYLYLKKDNNPSINFPKNWLNNIPGKVKRSYHLIFFKVKTLSEVASSILPLSPPIRLIVNKILVIASENSSSLKLFNSDIFGKKLFPSKNGSFFVKGFLLGESLIWGSTYLAPGLQQSNIDKLWKRRYPIDFIVTPIIDLTYAVNGTPRLTKEVFRSHGSRDINDKWTGMIGEVVSGRAHITQPIFISRERNEALLLTKTYYSDRMVFISGAAKFKSELSFLWDTFQVSIWLAQFFLVGAIALVLLYANKDLSVKKNLLEIIWIFGVVTKFAIDQGDTSKRYQVLLSPVKSKILIANWFLCVIVLGNVFKTNMISLSTSPTIEYPPDNFLSLTESHYKINFQAENQTLVGDVFRTLKKNGNMIANKLSTKVEGSYPFNSSDCFIKTQQGDNVCLGILYILQPTAITVLSSQESKQPLFRKSKDSLFTSNYVYGITKQLNLIRDRFDEIIIRCFEAGVYEHYVSLFYDKINLAGQNVAKTRKKAGRLYPSEINLLSAKSQSQKFETFNFIIILSIGISFCVVAFIFEVFIYRKRINRKNQNYNNGFMF